MDLRPSLVEFWDAGRRNRINPVAQERLKTSTGGAELFLRKATPIVCGPAFTGTRLKSPLDLFGCRRRKGVAVLFVFRATDARQLNALAIESDFKIVQDTPGLRSDSPSSSTASDG